MVAPFVSFTTEHPDQVFELWHWVAKIAGSISPYARARFLPTGYLMLSSDWFSMSIRFLCSRYPQLFKAESHFVHFCSYFPSLWENLHHLSFFSSSFFPHCLLSNFQFEIISQHGFWVHFLFQIINKQKVFSSLLLTPLYDCHTPWILWLDKKF